MGKVQFQVDGLDSNLDAIFNQDVSFDLDLTVNGNIVIPGLTEGTLVLQQDGVVTTASIPSAIQTALNQKLSSTALSGYATESYVNTALSGVTVDLSQNAGTGLDWNGSTSQFDIDPLTVQLRVQNISDTEIGYLDGVTSNIQTQLTSKAPKESPTFTGTLNAENIEISGALTFSGTATQIDVTNYAVEDSLIYLADAQFNTDILDIGIYGAYGITGHTGNDHYHTGFFRDASDSKWKLISAGTEPTDHVIDLTGVVYDTLAAGAFEVNSSTVPVNGMYLSSANTVGIASNSINRINFNSNGGINLLGHVTENINVSGSAASGTINFDVLSNNNILYYTSNSSANWTLNIRGNSSTTLNNLMSNGQSLTIVFMVTNGSTAYYQSDIQIDGTSITPKWQGGTAPTSGNASSIDVYEITIIKTQSNTYTVLENISKFA